MAGLSAKQRKDCEQFYQMRVWQQALVRYPAVDKALARRYIEALSVALDNQNESLGSLPPIIQQQAATRTMIAARTYRNPNEQTFAGQLIDPVCKLLHFNSLSDIESIDPPEWQGASPENIADFLTALGNQLQLPFSEQLDIIQTDSEKWAKELQAKKALTAPQRGDELTVYYLDSLLSFHSVIHDSDVCLEALCKKELADLNEPQQVAFKALFRQVIELAYNDNKQRLSRQSESLQAEVFKALLASAKDGVSDADVANTALAHYQLIKKHNEDATKKSQRQHQMAGVADVVLHLSANFHMQMTGADVTRGLPNTPLAPSVAIMAPQYQNDLSMRGQLVEPDELGESPLSAALKNPEIRHIVIPVGPGHWQGIYITKPEGEGPYQVELYDPYGEQAAQRSVQLKHFADFLFAGCGVNKNKSVTYSYARPPALQPDAYACGDFTVAYTHYKFKQWGLPEGSFDEDLIATFEKYGNQADILRHHSRVRSATLKCAELTARADLSEQQRAAQLAVNAIPEDSQRALTNAEQLIAAAAERKARARMAAARRVAAAEKPSAVPFTLATMTRSTLFATRPVNGALASVSVDLKQISQQRALLQARADVAAVLQVIERLPQGCEKKEKIEQALERFLRRTLSADTSKAKVSDDKALMAALAVNRNGWDPRVWVWGTSATQQVLAAEATLAENASEHVSLLN